MNERTGFIGSPNFIKGDNYKNILKMYDTMYPQEKEYCIHQTEDKQHYWLYKQHMPDMCAPTVLEGGKAG